MVGVINPFSWLYLILFGQFVQKDEMHSTQEGKRGDFICRCHYLALCFFWINTLSTSAELELSPVWLFIFLLVPVAHHWPHRPEWQEKIRNDILYWQITTDKSNQQEKLFAALRRLSQATWSFFAQACILVKGNVNARINLIKSWNYSRKNNFRNSLSQVLSMLRCILYAIMISH